MNLYMRSLLAAQFPEDAPAAYAWVITIDKINDAGNSAVGTAGPGRATPEQVALAHKSGRAFRMLDDDGELYYHGRLWESDGAESLADGFQPLDDFGAPDSGCTEIQFKDSAGAWVGL